MADLTAKIATVRAGDVVTADNDPNRLLGRPGGYTSAMSFADTRVPTGQARPQRGSIDAGGKVEVFDDEESARSRSEYIQTITKAAPMLSEYTYQSGPIVLRVARSLTPDQAAEFERALD